VKRRLTAVLAGAALAALVGGWSGLGIGAVVATVLWRVLARIPSTAQQALDRRTLTDLPLTADLLAAAMRAGVTPDRAALTVGAALGGPVGARLGAVGRGLRLGEPPVDAWRRLSEVHGAERLVRAVVRSTDSGAALARALTRLADELRDAAVADAEASARRAGVLVVLPLGLCFLPAFLLAGVVPVVIAILGDVLG
jgi:Flp pilus assembly protein TadB